jgi:hypothetical protein
MGEIFEVQIFCANLHKGNVKRALSSPIIGHVQVLNVNITGHLGCVLAHVLRLKNIQAEFCIFWETQIEFKQTWQYRKLIWYVGSQNNVLTTRAHVHHGCGPIMLSPHLCQE